LGEAVAAIERLGGHVELSARQGSGRVLAVDLTERPVGNDDLCCLEPFADLQRLSVRGWQVTDEGMAHVEKLNSLQILRLTCTGITDGGVSRLKDLADLRSLDLAGSFRVTDSALTVLRGLPHLQRLDLTFTRVTDHGIRALREARPGLEIRRRYTGHPESRPTAPDAPVQALGRWSPDTRGDTTTDPSRFIPRADALLAHSPDFVDAWRFLAWNVGFNVPAEFDDPRDRYFWATQSIKVLTTGAGCNKNAATSLWDVGWYTGSRIGRTDDADHFRRWFFDDAELHRLLIEGVPRERVLGPSGKPDNWLVAREWFLKAERLIDNSEDADIGKLSPVILFSESAMCQFHYAEAIEREGCFGETAKAAWREGEVCWRAFGDRLLPIGIPAGESRRLNQWEELAERAGALRKQLEAMQPGLTETIRRERYAALGPNARQALDKTSEDRTAEERESAKLAERQLLVSAADLAERIGGPNRQKALRLAAQATAAARTADSIRRYRRIVNYDYWLARARIEQEDATINARQLMYEAQKELARQLTQADPGEGPQTAPLFERTFRAWAGVLQSHPEFADDEHWCRDVLDAVRMYREHVLKAPNLPDDFPLRDYVDRWTDGAAHEN
jgi:hypothetical protein